MSSISSLRRSDDINFASCNSENDSNDLDQRTAIAVVERSVFERRYGAEHSMSLVGRSASISTNSSSSDYLSDDDSEESYKHYELSQISAPSSNGTETPVIIVINSSNVDQTQSLCSNRMKQKLFATALLTSSIAGIILLITGLYLLIPITTCSKASEQYQCQAIPAYVPPALMGTGVVILSATSIAICKVASCRDSLE